MGGWGRHPGLPGHREGREEAGHGGRSLGCGALPDACAPRLRSVLEVLAVRQRGLRAVPHLHTLPGKRLLWPMGWPIRSSAASARSEAALPEEWAEAVGAAIRAHRVLRGRLETPRPVNLGSGLGAGICRSCSSPAGSRVCCDADLALRSPFCTTSELPVALAPAPGVVPFSSAVPFLRVFVPPAENPAIAWVTRPCVPQSHRPTRSPSIPGAPEGRLGPVHPSA